MLDHVIYPIIVIIVTQWVALLLYVPNMPITNIGPQIVRATKKTRHLTQLSDGNFRRVIAGRRYAALVKWRWRQNWDIRQEPAPDTLCPPQTSHGARTQVFAVRSRWVSVPIIAEPSDRLSYQIFRVFPQTLHTDVGQCYSRILYLSSL